MGRNRFQAANAVRLPLSDGDWIEVRERLSGGEKRRMAASSFKGMRPSEDKPNEPMVEIDFGMLNMARTKSYLTAWSFRDKDDKAVRLTPDAIEALDEETLKEIELALDKHIEAVEAKNSQPSGEATSSQA